MKKILFFAFMLTMSTGAFAASEKDTFCTIVVSPCEQSTKYCICRFCNKRADCQSTAKNDGGVQQIKDIGIRVGINYSCSYIYLRESI